MPIVSPAFQFKFWLLAKDGSTPLRIILIPRVIKINFESISSRKSYKILLLKLTFKIE